MLNENGQYIYRLCEYDVDTDSVFVEGQYHSSFENFCESCNKLRSSVFVKGIEYLLPIRDLNK